MRLLLFPVGHKMQPLDPAPLLQPHYRPSSLVRAGPPQNLSSVLSPHGFRHLCFSLGIQVLVPVVPHRSLDWVHAPYTPAAVRLVTKFTAHSSQKYIPPLISAALSAYRRVIEGFAFARLPGPYLPGAIAPGFDSNAHHRGFWPKQLGVV
jgi:hypothetical protein